MYRACLQRQINEVDGLQAMFCGQDELTLWNLLEYTNLKEGKSAGEEQIAFQMQLPLTPLFPEAVSLVLRVTFPTFYPASEVADVHLSFDPLTPPQEQALRDAANVFVTSKLGKECMLDLVQFAKDWIYDNVKPASHSTPPATSSVTIVLGPAPTPVTEAPAAPKAEATKAPPQSGKAAKRAPAPPVAKAAAKPADAKAKPKPAVPAQKEYEFRRILIWFSTIAPDRSKTVAEWAKQLGLTGISRLGSPALIVVEGQKDDVDEYVSSLRSYRWKKMDIVWEEKMKTTNLNGCRRFTNFQENMLSLPDLQTVFKKAGLEDMYKEGLKIRG